MAAGDKRGCTPIAVAAVIVLLPVVYVLGIGPVYYCASKGYIPFVIAEVLYAPMELLSKNVEIAGRIIRWYLRFYGI